METTVEKVVYVDESACSGLKQNLFTDNEYRLIPTAKILYRYDLEKWKTILTSDQLFDIKFVLSKSTKVDTVAKTIQYHCPETSIDRVISLRGLDTIIMYLHSPISVNEIITLFEEYDFWNPFHLDGLKGKILNALTRYISPFNIVEIAETP